MMRMPQCTCVIVPLSIAAAALPPAVRVLPIALAVAQLCLPVSFHLTSSGVRVPDRGAIVGGTAEEGMAGGEAQGSRAGRDVGLHARKTLLPLTLP